MDAKPIKIALVGSAPSSVRLAPYHSPDWQIWACSPGVYGIAPRSDMWFELHRYEPGQPWFSPEYCQFLAKHAKVAMAEVRAEIPGSFRVPVEDLVAEFGPYFFTSSLSWMFAMAMKVIEAAGTPAGSAIGLWGVDMAANEEYGYQRAGCQFFAMLARARGIEVGVPPESDLLRPPPLYGVSELDHARIKIIARRRELQARMADAQTRMQAAQAEMQCMHAAMDDLTYFDNTWVGNIEAKYVEPPLVPALASLGRNERAG